MIKKIYRSELDLYNLSLKKTTNTKNQKYFDYKNIVVNKPWGYEYLMFENKEVAIWILHINYDFLTSMHCHPKKRTSLFLLDGRATITTLDSQFNLGYPEGLMIDSGVFHSTKATSPEGIFLMEIETPPDKNDLVRLKDKYGRENKGYEGKTEMSNKLHQYEYCSFNDIKEIMTKKIVHDKIKKRTIQIKQNKSFDSFYKHIKELRSGIFSILDKKIEHNKEVIYPGDIIDLQNAHKYNKIKLSNFISLIIY